MKKALTILGLLAFASQPVFAQMIIPSCPKPCPVQCPCTVHQPQVMQPQVRPDAAMFPQAPCYRNLTPQGTTTGGASETPKMIRGYW